jgi:uracil-DNA glycosylase family 4
VKSDWYDYLGAYFSNPAHGGDRIVPAHIAPHLLFQVAVSNVAIRTGRRVDMESVNGTFDLPFDKAGEGGIRYISAAAWLCPFACIEPEICPAIRGDRDWDLSRNFVPGDGPLNAQVMLIGQAPGRFEDRQRRPFVGRSGKLLDWMIKSARLKRENVYITSVVQFFPPKNRMPAAKEISLCKRFLSGQIKVIEPRFVILLGNVALNAVLGMRSVHANHGSVIRKDGTTYMITLHPAAALRFKKSKAIMRQDFSKFGRLIAESIKEVNV